MSWPEEEARRKAAIAAQAPQLWRALKAALRRDAEEFHAHNDFGPSVEFPSSQDENSLWMNVKRGTDLHTGRKLVNVFFDENRLTVSVNVTRPGQQTVFTINAGENGDVHFYRGGVAMSPDQVAESILKPLLSG
jgi:hypothetical protein